MPLSAAEREHISLQRRHAHAAGGLAQAVADAASPLFAAHSLGVAVQSFGVVAAALQALAATTEAVELDTNQVGAAKGVVRASLPRRACRSEGPRGLPLGVVGGAGGGASEGACEGWQYEVPVGVPANGGCMCTSSQSTPIFCLPKPSHHADPDAGTAAHRRGGTRSRHAPPAAQRAPGLGTSHGSPAGESYMAWLMDGSWLVGWRHLLSAVWGKRQTPEEEKMRPLQHHPACVPVPLPCRFPPPLPAPDRTSAPHPPHPTAPQPAGLACVSSGGCAAVPCGRRLPGRLLPAQALRAGGGLRAAPPAGRGARPPQHHRTR